MHRLSIVFLLIVGTTLLTGCSRLAPPPKLEPSDAPPKATTTPEQPQAKNTTVEPGAPPDEPKPKPRPKISTVGRRMELPKTRNYMKQLGLAYHNYCDSFNKAPSKWQDLTPFYDRNAQITEALKEGWWVFIPNVAPRQMTQGTSRTIVAYENDADTTGFRVVLMGDGSVSTMNVTDFEQAPRAGKN